MAINAHRSQAELDSLRRRSVDLRKLFEWGLARWAAGVRGIPARLFSRPGG
jgi:hypothetical protein